MDSELVDVTHKILSSPESSSPESIIRLWRRSVDGGKVEEALMKERSKVKKVLLKVDLKVEWLLQDVESSPNSAKQRFLKFAYLKLAFHLSMETS